MATRRQVREAVVSILYSSDMGNKTNSVGINSMLEEKKIRNKQKEFALALIDGIEQRQEALDDRIKAVLKEWDWDRVGSIERSILRLGSYEIVYGEADRAVVINEAVEIAKLFGAENAPRFVNGILDAIKKED